MTRFLSLALVFCTPAGMLAADAKTPPTIRTLFDFEDEAEAKAWSNLELPDAKTKEPAARWELSKEHATSGKRSLKITFAGGRWPTLTTTRIPADWMPYETFLADVTVNRPCLIGFTVFQEGSRRGGGWEATNSRWTKTEFLKRGTNSITAALHPNAWSALRPKLENGKELGQVVRLELFLYRPHEGEAIYVDNIRLSSAKEPPPLVKTQFQVLGTDLVVADVRELAKKLADQWVKPEVQTVAQVEGAFQAQYEELKKKHSRAVLTVFREGDKGFDPAQPDKVYTGWKDAYWNSHGPDGMTVERAANYGKQDQQELFMRHRSPLMRADLSSIPKGSKILAAKFLLVRVRNPEKERGPHRPNLWVAEACNRPWEEYEVNAYEYAKDKFWKAIGGTYYGDDPDFLPVYLAHGPGQDGCSTWDFTHAVRFWTDGKHDNHGFMLHGDSNDWFIAWYREAKEIKDRPALLVIYEPK